MFRNDRSQVLARILTLPVRDGFAGEVARSSEGSISAETRQAPLVAARTSNRDV